MSAGERTMIGEDLFAPVGGDSTQEFKCQTIPVSFYDEGGIQDDVVNVSTLREYHGIELTPRQDTVTTLVEDVTSLNSDLQSDENRIVNLEDAKTSNFLRYRVNWQDLVDVTTLTNMSDREKYTEAEVSIGSIDGVELKITLIGGYQASHITSSCLELEFVGETILAQGRVSYRNGLGNGRQAVIGTNYMRIRDGDTNSTTPRHDDDQPIENKPWYISQNTSHVRPYESQYTIEDATSRCVIAFHDMQFNKDGYSVGQLTVFNTAGDKAWSVHTYFPLPDEDDAYYRSYYDTREMFITIRTLER